MSVQISVLLVIILVWLISRSVSKYEYIYRLHRENVYVEPECFLHSSMIVIFAASVILEQYWLVFHSLEIKSSDFHLLIPL